MKQLLSTLSVSTDPHKHCYEYGFKWKYVQYLRNHTNTGESSKQQSRQQTNFPNATKKRKEKQNLTLSRCQTITERRPTLSTSTSATRVQILTIGSPLRQRPCQGLAIVQHKCGTGSGCKTMHIYCSPSLLYRTSWTSHGLYVRSQMDMKGFINLFHRTHHSGG